MKDSELISKLKDYFLGFIFDEPDFYSICLLGSGINFPIDKINDIDLLFVLRGDILLSSIQRINLIIVDLNKLFGKKISYTVITKRELEFATHTRFLYIEGRTSSYANYFKYLENIVGEEINLANIDFIEEPYSEYASLCRIEHDLIKVLSQQVISIHEINKELKKALKVFLGSDGNITLRFSSNQEFNDLLLKQNLEKVFQFKSENDDDISGKYHQSALDLIQNLKTLKYSELLEDSIFEFNIRPQNLTQQTTFIFIMGVNASGKSTVSRKLSGLLNYNLIHLDSIKYPLESKYSFLSVKTIDAYEILPEINSLQVPDSQKLILGYQYVCNFLSRELEEVLDIYSLKGKSVIIEGVHLDIQSVNRLESKYSRQNIRILKFYIDSSYSEVIKNLENLKSENDAKRDFSEFASKLNPTNKNNIWIIQDYFLRLGPNFGWKFIKNRHGLLKHTIYQIYNLILDARY